MEDSLQDNINIRVPIKIGYPVLESVLRKKMRGEYIKTESENGKTTNYAEVLDVTLQRSPERDYDLAVELKFRTLTSLFRNKEGNLLIFASLNFDEHKQLLSVKDYKLKVDSNSWLLDKSFQVIANSFVYDRIKSKMKFNFLPLIEKQLLSINEKLENPLEAVEGVNLSGFLNDFSISQIISGDEMLLAIVEIEATAFIDIKNIDF